MDRVDEFVQTFLLGIGQWSRMLVPSVIVVGHCVLELGWVGWLCWRKGRRARGKLSRSGVEARDCTNRDAQLDRLTGRGWAGTTGSLGDVRGRRARGSRCEEPAAHGFEAGTVRCFRRSGVSRIVHCTSLCARFCTLLGHNGGWVGLRRGTSCARNLVPYRLIRKVSDGEVLQEWPGSSLVSR